MTFAVGRPGKVMSKTASTACVASIQRLIFEAQTLAVQQLRLQLTSPESVSKHVSEAERILEALSWGSRAAHNFALR